MKEKIDWRIVCTALIVLGGIEIYALSQGINGTMLSIVIAIIAGIAGWTVPQLKTK